MSNDLPAKSPASVPVIVLTGFLGSGKTTLLNAMLKLPALAGTAVIINEFGETALDHHLVEAADDGIIELANGCLCCTVRGQLVDTLAGLLSRAAPPKAIIIETTGLADPLPVLAAILSAPEISGRLSFRGLLTVFDCLDGMQTLARYDEARHQAMLADRIVLSKADLIDGPAMGERIKGELSSRNPHCRLQTSAEFLHEIANCGTESWPECLVPADHRRESGDHGAHHHHHDVNRHSDRICCVTLRAGQPLKRSQLDIFLDLMLSAHGDHVLRIKGLVDLEGENRPLLVQAAGRRLSMPEYLATWPNGMRQTSLVAFLDGMDPAFVTGLFASATNRISVDQADQQALANNPLAIGGIRFGGSER